MDVSDLAEASFEFCPFCGEITIGNEQHDCTPFRYARPEMVELIKIRELLEKILVVLELNDD